MRRDHIEALAAVPVVGFGAYEATRIVAGNYYENHQISPAKDKLNCAHDLAQMPLNHEMLLPDDCDAEQLLNDYGQSQQLAMRVRMESDHKPHLVPDTPLETGEVLVDTARTQLATAKEHKANYEQVAGEITVGIIGLGAVAALVAKRYWGTWRHTSSHSLFALPRASDT